MFYVDLRRRDESETIFRRSVAVRAIASHRAEVSDAARGTAITSLTRRHFFSLRSQFTPRKLRRRSIAVAQSSAVHAD